MSDVMLIAFIAAIPSAITSITGYMIMRDNRKYGRVVIELAKVQAETRQIDTSAITTAVPTLWQRIQAQEEAITQLKLDNEALRKDYQQMKHGVQILVSQLRALGYAPIWEPKE